jgi:hypothetical protein
MVGGNAMHPLIKSTLRRYTGTFIALVILTVLSTIMITGNTYLEGLLDS